MVCCREHHFQAVDNGPIQITENKWYCPDKGGSDCVQDHKPPQKRVAQADTAEYGDKPPAKKKGKGASNKHVHAIQIDSEQDGRDGSDTESEDDEDTRTVGDLLERAAKATAN